MFAEFKCRCGHAFRTHIQNAGRQIPCPNCLTTVTVPAPEATSVEAIESAATRPITKKEPVRESDATRQTRKPASEKSASASDIKRSVKAATSSPSRTSKKSKTGDPSEDLFDLSDIGPLEAPEQDDGDELFELPVSPTKKRRAKAAAEAEESDSKKGTKSSKKPKRDQGQNAPLIIGGVVAGFVVVAALGFFALPPLIAAMKQGGKIVLPQEFDKFEDGEIFFRCDYPKGWQAESRGGSGNIPPSVRIEQGRIKISYRASNSGAAMQDMAQAGANMMGELPDDQKPVARVHDFQRQKFSDEMPNYAEVGQVEKIETGWGEGRLSLFSASGGFGSKIFGYRVTLLTTNFQWNIVCQCPTKREFEAWKPVFRRIVESTGR